MERHRDSGSQEAREAVSLPAPATTGPAGESPKKTKKKTKDFQKILPDYFVLQHSVSFDYQKSKKTEGFRFRSGSRPVNYNTPGTPEAKTFSFLAFLMAQIHKVL